MRLCPHCQRHILAAERACRFCGQPQLSVAASATLGVVFGIAAVSCFSPVDTIELDGPAAGTDPAPPVITTLWPVDPTTDGDADTSDPAGPPGFPTLMDTGPPIFECSVFAQGCPAGEKCLPWSNDGAAQWNATRCSPIPRDPKQLGESCTVERSIYAGIDDCDVGLMCWNVDETLTGRCEAFCTGSWPLPVCEDPASTCAIMADEAIAFCLPKCDPLVQDCAIAGEACYPFEADWACAPIAADGAYGDACSSITACSPGFVCLDDSLFATCDGKGCCTPVCDLDDAIACASLEPPATCAAWYLEGNAPPGLDDLGACIPDTDVDPPGGSSGGG